ncbi:MAG: mandelate racemase/muconate lactonizing enzyme family protein [Chitinophagaceae bacterium]
MRIKSIEYRIENLELTRPYSIAYKTISKVENVVAVITLEDGIEGMGTANPSTQVVGDNEQDTLLALQQWDKELLLKKDIRQFYDCLYIIHSSLKDHAGARAALDIALHDAFSQWLRIPLVQFLGQRIQSLPTSITIGIKGMEETMLEAAEYYERGFRYLKIKLGKNLKEDIERIKHLRKEYKDSIHIRIDANQGYHPDEVLHLYNEVKSLKLELIEQPLSVSDTSKLKQLPLNIRKMIAADESLVNVSDALQLACHPESCGIFNIKLMKCGGIQPAIEIAAVAAAAGIDLMWGCNDESAISISGALHVAFSQPHTRYIDLDGSLDLAKDIVTKAFTLKEGLMSVTGLPGLGWIK